MFTNKIITSIESSELGKIDCDFLIWTIPPILALKAAGIKHNSSPPTLRTSSLFHFSINKLQNLVINLARVNNFRFINKMFLDMRQNMNPGGLYMGSFSPLDEDYEKFRDKMPKFLFTLVYPFHFLFHRITPKLPIFKIKYFQERKSIIVRKKLILLTVILKDLRPKKLLLKL